MATAAGTAAHGTPPVPGSSYILPGLGGKWVVGGTKGCFASLCTTMLVDAILGMTGRGGVGGSKRRRNEYYNSRHGNTARRYARISTQYLLLACCCWLPLVPATATTVLD